MGPTGHGVSMNTEALKRKLSDALAAYQQDDLMHLDGLVG